MRITVQTSLLSCRSSRGLDNSWAFCNTINTGSDFVTVAGADYESLGYAMAVTEGDTVRDRKCLFPMGSVRQSGVFSNSPLLIETAN